MVEIHNAMPAKAYSTEQAAGCSMIASIHAALYAPGKKHANQGRTPDTVCQRLVDLCNWSGQANNWVHGSVTVQLKRFMGTVSEGGRVFSVDANNDLVLLVKKYKALEASIASSTILGPKATRDSSTLTRPSRHAGAGRDSARAAASAGDMDAAVAMDILALSSEFEVVEDGGFFFCATRSFSYTPATGNVP